MSWEAKFIPEVALIVSGNTPKGVNDINRSEGIPYFKVADMNTEGNERLMIKANKYLSTKDIAELKIKTYPRGTTIFPKRGGAIMTNKKRMLCRESAFDLNIMGIIPLKDLDEKYLYLWIQNLDLASISDGSNVPQINNKNITPLSIPLPPLPKQHHIVAKIEELFSKLDAGVESLKKAKEQLKTYRQAVLKAAFEGKLTSEWKKDQSSLPRAEELLGLIQDERSERFSEQQTLWKNAVLEWEEGGENGKKPSRISKPKTIDGVDLKEIENYEVIPQDWMWTRMCNVTYKIGDIDHKMPKEFSEGMPYLSTGNLKKDGSIDFDNAKTISKDDFDRLALKIKPEKGDIIFPRYGTIGRNILVNFNKEFLVSYSCAIIKNITSLMDEKYVYFYSISPVIKKEIERYTVQTTQANIGIASIENFVFPLCSFEEQHQVVKEIESRLSVCDKLEQTIEQQLKQSESLWQSILKRAFEGRLV